MTNELRWNPVAHRWVTIASERGGRPIDGPAPAAQIRRAPHVSSCPFCPGNENETLPAIVTIRGGVDLWSLRVVPNMYPSFAGTEVAATNRDDTAPASGSCEVVIFTPDHHRDIADLDTAEVVMLLEMIADRRDAHARFPTVRHTSAIVNRGINSGASLTHAHAQLLSTPFVPPTVYNELLGFSREPDLLRRAFGPDQIGLVERRDGAIAGCPAWAGLPYESWIVPTDPRASFLEARPHILHDFAELLVDQLRRLRTVLGDIDYNIIFRLPPHRSEQPFTPYIRVFPRHVPIAGFEISSGIAVNSVPPERAARHLRDAAV